MKHYIFVTICCLLWVTVIRFGVDFSERPLMEFTIVCLIVAANATLHLSIDMVREKFALPPRTICLFTAGICLILSIAGATHWEPSHRQFFNLYPYFLAFGAPLTFSYVRRWSDTPTE